MPRAAAQPKATPPADEARVTVVGGGLAGLTSALKLAQRGFKVTLYEASDALGGNLSSETVNGVDHDVYPHMFCDWYANFWDLFETDLGLDRNEHFEPRMGVKLLKPPPSQYQELENATTWDAIKANLRSGVGSAPDMFLLGFSMLDLAATPFERSATDQLEQLDVNGFIYSRGYSTERVAALQNYMLMVIWSVRSELTSAASYQDFIKHTLAFPHPTPFSWLLKGPLSKKIIEPFEQKLTQLGVDIQKNRAVRGVQLVDGKLNIRLESARPAKGGAGRSASVDAPAADYVVLAVPAPALAKLVVDGPRGNRIVDRLPQLAELRRLRGEPIPVVDVYFNKKLPEIPKEQVGLTESNFDLTVLDLSQLWTGEDMEQGTALVLAASNGYALPSAEPWEQGHMMIRKLHDYLPVFDPGERWGDPKSDVCWEKTHFRSNEGNKLFINEVGSWGVRPVTSYPEIPNVFFAGDFCQTDVDMATIEAAVQSGLLAAQALQSQDAKGKAAPRGEPITTAVHEVYSDATFLAAKLALLPAAYVATAGSAVVDALRKKGPLTPNSYSPLTYSLLLPLAFSLDWWKTAYWLTRRLLPGGAPPSADHTTGLRGAQAPGLGAGLTTTTSPTPPAGDDSAQRTISSALAVLADQTWRTVQAGLAAARGPGQGAEGAPYQRRWRAKR